MRLIETHTDIDEALAALSRADPRLAPVIAASGEVPLRRTAPGFASLVSIIVSQQVSRASADAILGRLVTLVDPLEPGAILAAGEDVFRTAGLSRPKQRTLQALAQAVSDGALDLAGLSDLPPDEAMARLVAVSGIGPWTAEIYLLFAVGHPDIFPAKDVALQTAVGHALGLSPRPDARSLYLIAESWAPWRGIAARLFWAYYRTLKGREAIPPA